MGSKYCARTIDITHDIECRPTTTETPVAYDNSTWHAMNTTRCYITDLVCFYVGMIARRADL